MHREIDLILIFRGVGANKTRSALRSALLQRSVVTSSSVWAPKRIREDIFTGQEKQITA